MKNRKLLALLLALVLCTGVLTACGGSGKEDETKNAATLPAPDVPTGGMIPSDSVAEWTGSGTEDSRTPANEDDSQVPTADGSQPAQPNQSDAPNADSAEDLITKTESDDSSEDLH